MDEVMLDASVRAEADPYNLAPTASTVAAGRLGDALALAVRQARNLTCRNTLVHCIRRANWAGIYA